VISGSLHDVLLHLGPVLRPNPYLPQYVPRLTHPLALIPFSLCRIFHGGNHTPVTCHGQQDGVQNWDSLPLLLSTATLGVTCHRGIMSTIATEAN
jgi:hypothetical protein